MASQPGPTADVHAVFVGGILEASVRGILQAISTGIANSVGHIHLLFQSGGGNVGDGVCLYNYLRTLRTPFTIYNVGSVCSIATLAYLGAEERKASASATFMLHRTRVSPQATTANRLRAVTNALVLDDERTEAIWRERLTLTPEQWDIHEHDDLWLSADQALTAGLVTSIGDFAPALGQPVYFI